MAQSPWYTDILTGSSAPIDLRWMDPDTISTLPHVGNNQFGAWRIPLPFSFNFLGKSYTDFYLHTQGYITFGAYQLDNGKYEDLLTSYSRIGGASTTGVMKMNS